MTKEKKLHWKWGNQNTFLMPFNTLEPQTARCKKQTNKTLSQYNQTKLRRELLCSLSLLRINQNLRRILTPFL